MSDAMRLLVLELGHSAGSATVVNHILAELPGLGVETTFAAPRRRREELAAAGGLRGIATADPHLPTRVLGRLAGVIATRLAQTTPDTLRKSTAFARGLHRLLNRLGSSALGEIVQRHRITHLWVPNIFDNLPPHLGLPTGVMAMDLNWRHNPAAFAHRNVALLEWKLARWLRRADAIFPVSEFSAEELVAAFPACRAKTTAVPHAADLHLPNASATAALRPPETPLFFTPASITANKCHGVLLDAALKLFAAGRDFRLVLTGREIAKLGESAAGTHPLIEPLRRKLADNAALVAGRIEPRGFVSAEEIESLYARAWRVVMPSSYEGFGLPVVEAFERGAGVICTRIPPFLEQARRYEMDDRVNWIDTGSADDLARALDEAITAGPLPRLAPAVLAARLQRWTWRDAAAAYVAGLRAIGTGRILPSASPS